MTNQEFDDYYDAEEATKEMDGKYLTDHRDEGRLTVEPAGRGNRRAKKDGPDERDKCFRCGKPGHW